MSGNLERQGTGSLAAPPDQAPPGRISIRLGKLHPRLKRLSRRDGRSINWHVHAAVSAYLKENGA